MKIMWETCSHVDQSDYLDLIGVDAIMCVEWSMIFTFASQLVITF